MMETSFPCRRNDDICLIVKNKNDAFPGKNQKQLDKSIAMVISYKIN
jgi:hypothetical protein